MDGFDSETENKQRQDRDVAKMPNVAQNNVATEWEQRFFREQSKLACYAEPK